MKEIELIEKTIKVDNSDNAECQYRIEAQVKLRNGKITELNSGYVFPAEGGLQLCYFYGLDNLNVQFNGVSEDRAAIFAAIDEFEASLKAEGLS